MSYDLDPRDNGDGTWSYVLPTELDDPVDIVVAGLTWSYVGQYSFPVDVIQAGPHPSPGDATTPPEDVIEVLRRSVRIDKYGRAWQVSDVDEVAVRARIEASRAEARDIEGDGTDVSDIAWSTEPDAEVTLHSWYSATCSSSEYFNWDADDRVVQYTPLSSRQLAQVVLVSGGLNAPFCSGVMIDRDVVLTAAHCLYGRSPSAAAACSRGVYVYDDGSDLGICRGVDSFLPYPDYNSGNDMNVDLGLVFLETTPDFPPDIGEMALSVASDATIDAFTGAYNLASPAWRDTSPCVSGVVYDGDIDSYGAYMTRDIGEVNQVTQKKVGTRIDGGPGHSGSPIFYCPGGSSVDVCGAGETGYVIAVWSGHYNGGTTRYNGGPKVPYYRDWIIGELP